MEGSLLQTGSLEPAPPLRLLMELRPCFDGFAGIPQETRLLFGAFSKDPAIRLGGLLNGSNSVGKTALQPPRDEGAGAIFAQSARLIALDTGADEANPAGPLQRALKRVLPKGLFSRLNLITNWGTVEKLSGTIDPELFGDWLWTRLFSLGLSPEYRPLLARASFEVPSLSWGDSARLAALAPQARARLDLSGAGWDIYIAHTPSPYKLLGGKAIVRYHDAIPVLWPHTISHAGTHARGHFRMLQSNVAEGAWFVCTSEPVREDLLRMFPRAESRTIVIPTLSAGHFKPDARPRSEIASIIDRGRAAAAAALLAADKSGASFKAAEVPEIAFSGTRGSEGDPFILAVSTLEPRKNYGLLMRAAAAARRAGSNMRLVIVASPGWRSEAETRLLRRLTSEGIVYHLSDVTPSDLRVLYSAAHAVICPSRAEGFDLATVEAMACGAPLLASDIPVHRWVCEDAAIYFDAYDEAALSRLLIEVSALPRGEGLLAEMSERGLRRASLYKPDVLVPKWMATLEQVQANRTFSPPA